MTNNDLEIGESALYQRVQRCPDTQSLCTLRDTAFAEALGPENRGPLSEINHQRDDILILLNIKKDTAYMKTLGNKP